MVATRSRSTMLVLAAALSFLVISGASQSPHTRVGVVDLNRVFDGASKREELQATLAEMKSDFATKISKLDERIAKLRSDLDLLEKGTSRHGAKEKDLFGAIQERKYEMQRFEEHFKGKKAELQEQLYGEITGAVEEYGRVHNFDLILQDEFAIADDERLTWKSVLYRRDGLDITDEVLAVLND